MKKNTVTARVCLGLITLGLLYLLWNKFEIQRQTRHQDEAQGREMRFLEQLNALDRSIYREDLKRQKILNFGLTYLKVLDLIPESYAVDSFQFSKSGRWSFDLTLTCTHGWTFDPVPKAGVLKNAQVKDIYIHDQPGKHVSLIL